MSFEVFLIFSKKSLMESNFISNPDHLHCGCKTRSEARDYVEKNLLKEFNEYVKKEHYCEGLDFPCPLRRTKSDERNLAQWEKECSDSDDMEFCPGPENMAEDVAIKANMYLPKDAEVVDTWGVIENPYGCWIQVVKIVY